MKIEKPISGERALNSALDFFREKTGISGKIEAINPLVSPDFRADAAVSILIGKTETPFLVDIKDKIESMRDVDFFLSMVPIGFLPLVVAKTINAQTKEALLGRGVAYIEEGGDFYLPILGGKRPKLDSKKIANKQVTRNPKSLPYLKIAFAFLQYPETKVFPLMKLAKALNLSIGSASQIKNDLLSNATFEDIPNAWMRWATTYIDFIKFHESHYLGKFRCEKATLATDWKKLNVADYSAVWGGESAAALITKNFNPESFTLYLEEGSRKITSNLGLVPDENGELMLFKAFWSDIDLGMKSKAYADPLVVFADLIFSESSRNRLIAREILKSVNKK